MNNPLPEGVRYYLADENHHDGSRERDAVEEREKKKTCVLFLEEGAPHFHSAVCLANYGASSAPDSGGCPETEEPREAGRWWRWEAVSM